LRRSLNDSNAKKHHPPEGIGRKVNRRVGLWRERHTMVFALHAALSKIQKAATP
jgi:hypothetical protein